MLFDLLFAGTNGGGGVFKSTDGGEYWSAMNTGLINTYVHALALSPDYVTDHTLFAGTWDAGHGDGGVFKSTNGGASWSIMGLPDLWISSLALSPGYATDHTLFAGTNGGGVFKSTDGGASWSNAITGLTNWDFQALALSSGYTTDRTLFAGVGTISGYSRGGKVFKSTDGGA